MIAVFDGLVVLLLVLALLAWRVVLLRRYARRHRYPRRRVKDGFWRMLFSFNRWTYDDFYP